MSLPTNSSHEPSRTAARAPAGSPLARPAPASRLEILRANLLSGSAMVVVGLVVMLGGLAFLINQDDQVYVNQRLADAAPIPRSGTYGYRPYPSDGPPSGEPVKPVCLYRADGEAVDLITLCKQDPRPLLLMTGSLTSSATARRTRSLKRLEGAFGDAIRIAVIYTREVENANYDPSVWLPRTGSAPAELAESAPAPPASISPPQTLEQRCQLADQYRALTQLEVPIYVDGLDNAICEYLGGGSNMALLLDAQGRVLARQRWFHGRSMARRIRRALEQSVDTAARPS